MVSFGLDELVEIAVNSLMGHIAHEVWHMELRQDQASSRASRLGEVTQHGGLWLAFKRKIPLG